MSFFDSDVNIAPDRCRPVSTVRYVFENWHVFKRNLLRPQTKERNDVYLEQERERERETERRGEYKVRVIFIAL